LLSVQSLPVIRCQIADSQFFASASGSIYLPFLLLSQANLPSAKSDEVLGLTANARTE
jgi:hypothetical protein